MPPKLRPPSLSREAEADIAAAVDWYIGESTFSAAYDFLDEIEHAKNLLSMFAKVGEAGMHNTRMLPLHKFPYSLIYRLQGDMIRIIAVVHHSRRPGYWAGRR
jgi:plasmid stabilization system protein ParE